VVVAAPLVPTTREKATDCVSRTSAMPRWFPVLVLGVIRSYSQIGD
jgi:hypothetical protein